MPNLRTFPLTDFEGSWFVVKQTILKCIHRIHKWWTCGKELVMRHGNEAFSDRKLSCCKGTGEDYTSFEVLFDQRSSRFFPVEFETIELEMG